eukprot:2311754-Pleurochrysis_carterae.AAC.1
MGTTATPSLSRSSAYVPLSGMASQTRLEDLTSSLEVHVSSSTSERLCGAGGVSWRRWSVRIAGCALPL